MESITEQNIRNIVEGYGDIDYIAIRHHKFSKEVRQDSLLCRYSSVFNLFRLWLFRECKMDLVS